MKNSIALLVLLCIAASAYAQIPPLKVNFYPTQVPNYPAGTYWYTGT